MNDQKRDLQNNEEAPKSNEGVQGSPAFSWKRFLAKKWVFPATYMAAAAIILTLMWVYQDAGKSALNGELGLDGKSTTVTNNVMKPESVAVNTVTETMQLPFKEKGELDVILPYFDSKASNEVRQAAMVEYGDTFTPHMGMDFAKHDNSVFDVQAAMSGKVTTVEKNPVVGNLVEITHSNGLVTVYQSLAEIKVAKDADVKKGDVIAKAGRNELEKDQGVHLHFEVRQGENGASVNPEQFFAEH
ncbi:M23 family metallopeptidase [Paenibacillus radicis (ex Xue et al. 2023)]|uniref:M23 family metallopeptidase n=1 Tax=Paenibacillus radicis (ex Xue et al. 2023) TaxID=2972489 RepID=A0ABT1YK35_9BACL|nr:M23 family metallopeptidase [Paenibacillus radicis (ex Xue et al. 2023)]MCR8632340.1 M23 family metallopeptidase [Paenibacillus radicis (ex Xue et al. 2023)]